MSQLAILKSTDAEMSKEALYNTLITGMTDNPVSDLLAKMLASQQCGFGVMPRWLGLSHKLFATMLASYLPAAELDSFEHLRDMLDPERFDEHEDLRALFNSHQTEGNDDAVVMADILTAGCMGGDHLWQDMGFWSRKDLSAFIYHAFTPLAEKNVYDMKWKKFFYKQLCNQEGVYTCRAPSCQVCNDYQECFGPE